MNSLCEGMNQDSALRSDHLVIGLMIRGILVAMALLVIGTQVTLAEDYVPYNKRYQEQVFRTNVRPRWFPDETGLWYRIQTDQENHEFVFVNAETGERTSGADFQSLKIETNSEIKTSETVDVAQPRSMRTGIACSMTFINKTENVVQLHWVDPRGRDVEHGVIEPGQTVQKGTFESHLWRLADEDGNTLARVTAELYLNRILIDGPSPHLRSNHPREAFRRFSSGVSPDKKWRVTHHKDEVTIARTDSDQKSVLTVPLKEGAQYFGRVAWSPNSDAFVISAAIPVATRKITIVETSPTDQLQPKRMELDYAKPGDDLPQPTPVLFRLEEGQFKATVVDNALFDNQFTTEPFQRYRWSTKGNEFYFDYNQRGHQCFRILAVNAETAEVRAVVDEVSPTFIDYRKKTWRNWLKNDSELLWLSERDGWTHLWHYDVTGKQPPQQLTNGKWVVKEVLHVDEESETIWFMASGLRADEDPYNDHLCRVQFDGSGFLQLTEAIGFHEVAFSPKRNYFVATWSRIDHPPVVELRSSKDGKLICEMEKADASLMLESGGVFPETFVAKGRDGKTDIYGVIYKPTNFDETKTYPIVENIYAGPHAAFTPKQFGADWKKQDMADAGFIVVQADGMGTNFRGKAFHDVSWKNLKDAGFPDRIEWIKAAAETRPWMDLSRVGIYGGSAGGQSAMRALLDHSDFYHVAVADCGCHDNRMDKIWWNEQWMGWPIDESYSKSSNSDDAHKLEGKLLLIVGELDTNVDPASTYQVVSELQKANKTFDFMPMINTGHGAAETPYGSKLRKDYLIRHLKP